MQSQASQSVQSQASPAKAFQASQNSEKPLRASLANQATETTPRAPITPRSFSNPSSPTRPISISPPISPRLSPRMRPKLPSSSPPPLPFDISHIPEYPHLMPPPSPPREETPFSPLTKSRASSVSSSQPERVFLDLRQSIYVRFRDSATGHFSIYDASNNDAAWGYACFLNGERDGNWVQYFNGDTRVVKQQGSYRMGLKDGVFTTYFDNSKEVFMTVPYTNGRRDGYTLVYQRGHQLLSAIYYDRGVEKKRIEYYANGYLKRISMITNKPRVYAMIEFQDNGNVLYIGEARRSHVNDSLFYSHCGKGSFFYSHRAQLTGEFEKDYLLLDGKKVSIADCRNSLRIVDKKISVVETPDGVLPPWKPVRITKTSDARWIEYDGKKQCVFKMKNIVVSDREYKQKALFSFLGYPLSAVESNYSETKIYEYYPFISIQNAVEVDNVKLHSVVPGIITSSSVCKREEYVGDRLVKEREYSNIGKQ